MSRVWSSAIELHSFLVFYTYFTYHCVYFSAVICRLLFPLLCLLWCDANTVFSFFILIRILVYCVRGAIFGAAHGHTSALADYFVVIISSFSNSQQFTDNLCNHNFSLLLHIFIFSKQFLLPSCWMSIIVYRKYFCTVWYICTWSK